MIIKDEKIFIGGQNSDDDARVMPQGDVRSLWYCRLGDANGHGFCIVTSEGTREVTSAFIEDKDDSVIGAKEWVEANAIVYFVYCGADKPSGHKVCYYDIAQQQHYLIAASAEFNFKENNLISHIEIVDNNVYWCDDYWNDEMYSNGLRVFNPPYHINIKKALNSEYPFYSFNSINFVKFPHVLPPKCVYSTDQLKADNKLRSKLFRFRAQYVYWGNEETVWSPYSNLALPSLGSFVDGTNWIDSSQDNCIDITINTGSFCVRKINVAVSENDGQFGVFIQIDKDKLGLLDNVDYTFRYYGNTSDKALPLALNNYDTVPIQSNCLSKIPENRMVFTNNVVGYNNVDINVRVESVYTEMPISTTEMVLTIVSLFNADTYLAVTHNRNTEFRFSTGHTAILTMTIGGTDHLFTYSLTDQDIFNALNEATILAQNEYIGLVFAQYFAYRYNEITGTLDAVASTGGIGVSIANINYSGSASFGGTIYHENIILPRLTLSQPTLKTGAHHQFYIQYYDEANRDGTALTTPFMSLYVPFYTEAEAFSERNAFLYNNSFYTVNPKFTITNIPPVWATHWQILAKATTEISSFQQVTVTNFVSNGNRVLIDIQSKYQITNKGALINHQITKGDKMRFIKKRLDYVTAPNVSDYVETYFELEVLEYDPTGGFFGNGKVTVENFDLELIEGTGDPNPYRGQLVEIYTPKPILNTEDGSLFVSEVREIGVYGTIGNVHTDDRYHKSPNTQTGICIQANFTDTFVIVEGIYNGIEGATFYMGEFNENNFGTISSSVYDPITNTSTLNIGLPIPGAYIMPQPFTASFDQVVSGGTSLSDAIIYSNWGDVWLRYRNMNSGYTNDITTDPLYYWLIEDPCYSDYWVSHINGKGRIAAVVPTNKQTRLIATAVHGGSFIDNTQINNLCSFGFVYSNRGVITNIQSMDEQYGPVIRTIVSGKTLKCFQPKKENSIYINAGGYSIDANGEDAPVSISNAVFTQWRPMSGSYGTIDPDSVAILPNQDIVYFDAISGAFVRVLANGQENISDGPYKFKKRTKELTAFKKATDAFVHVFIDEKNGEVGWGFKRNKNDYTAADDPIVTFDYVRNRWRSSYAYPFDRFANHGQVLVGFGALANRQMHLHNDIQTLMFHGRQKKKKIVFVSNVHPSIMKRFQNIGIRSNAIQNWEMPDATIEAESTYPIQRTSLIKEEFYAKENIQWSQIKRNEVNGSRINGNVMRGYAITIAIENSYNGRIVTYSVEIHGVIS